ncbi:MAG: rRNA maturation RNase YbeY [Candidatus Omnitrophica bacterium]|nr:rRNA maturation RNase YbeY [Candidatus Omnitrophota bacterium]
MVRRSFDIQIRSEAKKFRISLSRLKKTARKILKIVGWKKGTLGILLLNDAGIRKINCRYLKHDRPTDVIAFPLLSLRAPKGRSNLGFLGDIAISLETAKRAGKELGTGFDYEVCLYLCHGILHLMGYDDHNPSDRAKMWRKQDRILRTLYFRKGYQKGYQNWPYKKLKHSS